MRHQIAHGVHAVVRGGIQLVHVERRAPGDLGARGAYAARFAVAGLRQFNALARIRADEVFPVPRGPLNR